MDVCNSIMPERLNGSAIASDLQFYGTLNHPMKPSTVLL